MVHTHEPHSDDTSNEKMPKQNPKMHPQGLLRIIARILTPTLARALMAATVLPHARLMAAIGKQVDISKECGDNETLQASYAVHQ